MSSVESVWDYPRPPRVEATTDRVRVIFAGQVIADTVGAHRVLETSHPPAYYVPPADVAGGVLQSNDRVTYCEFKGVAHYRDVAVGERVATAAAWFYPEPTPGYEGIAGYISFYAAEMDECWVGDQLVVPQPGSFYGGWITPDIRGPFKRA